MTLRTVTTPIVYAVLKKIEARQAPTRAILARQIIGGICKLAILTHRADYNVADPLKGEIARHPVQHRKHLRDIDLPDFLRRLEDYPGHQTTATAMKLLMLTAVRPGEICGARWEEFDFEHAEWVIPAERMKMGEEHIVPLSRQAIALLEQLKELTGHDPHLFPANSTKSAHIPTGTLRNAIVKLGYADRFNPHGARGTFSTACNEAGFRADVIEAQLAHAERNQVRGSYNRAQYLPERRQMMQSYSDHLDALKLGAQIIPFNRAA